MLEKNRKFQIFPEWKIYNDFPWQIFAIGWICILKGIIWIALDPDIPENILKIFGYKYLITMIPYIILGIGIWNLRKWAVKGIIILTIADLIFFVLLLPDSYNSLMVFGHSMLSGLLFIALLITNGPVGGIFILCLFPAMLKYECKIEDYCNTKRI